VAALEKQIKDLAKKKPKDLKEQTAAMQAKIDAIKAGTPHYHMLMANAVEEAALFVVNKEKEHGTKLDYKMGMARDLELMKRGNPNDLGEACRVVSCLRSRLERPACRASSTRQRPPRTGAGLVEDAAPLTARVMVNRVWKHHFGRGLVDTPSEFGNLGEMRRRILNCSMICRSLHGARLVAEVAASRDPLNSATWRNQSALE
jgi:hypothetical protein